MNNATTSLPPLAAAQNPTATSASTMPTAAANNPLEQLKDIHLPDPISWWPPAMGWWLVVLLGLALIATITIITLRHWRRNAYRRQALKALKQIEAQDGHSDYSKPLSQLLRSCAIAAGIPGAHHSQAQDWYDILTQHMPPESADFFARQRYKADTTTPPLATLADATRSWIKQHKTCNPERTATATTHNGGWS